MQFKSVLSILALLFSIQFITAQELKSPSDFLPHKLGEHFTPHHLLVDYFQHVAENSPRMVLQEYGRTNQGRPLIYAIISTPENLRNVEQIRMDHLKSIGIEKGKLKGKNDKALVWLSYGVHGNEAGASESSLAAIYEFANPANKKTEKWLENVVIIFDPCVNPDGYSRYTHWNRNVVNHHVTTNPESIEHDEPWPGGRVNHYLFDLNRDWAWQTQVESQQRIEVYNQWMPHVHVDFHEMYHNDPYYFAPAAQPYHTYVTPWQSEFQKEVGKNHARYFDKEGWLYFTREVFDLLYPSYGDTWPIFHGAIGMTYEQGGHSNSSRAIDMENGDTLRLSDRIAHHRTTSLSTVEVCSNNADRLIQRFSDYYSKAIKSPQGEYKTYVILGDNPSGKIDALCKMLDRNGIQYGFAGSAGKYSGYSYRYLREQSVEVKKSDLIISAHQPLSTLTQVLFEPEPALVDSLTYDITAWALPFAFGLEAYALKQKIEVGKPYTGSNTKGMNSKQSDNTYAWLLPWKSLEDARFLGALMDKGIRVRSASVALELQGKKYEPGTIVITRADNKTKNLKSIISELSKKYNNELDPVTSGLSSWGPDLGSEKMTLLKTPKVLVLSGESVSPYSFGQVWYYFEQELGFPLTVVDADNVSSVDLDNYNLLVMPEGSYSKLTGSGLDEFKSWIRKGGRVIAVGQALGSLEGKAGFKLKKYATDDDENIAKRARKRAEMMSRLDHYSGRERRFISASIPGAIYRLKMDNTHPLAYGMQDYYYSLKTSTRAYQHLNDVWNVGYIGKDPQFIGFVGAKVQDKMKETTIFGVQDMGAGKVIYMVDNPLFRGFWEQGKFLFSNALFLVQ